MPLLELKDICKAFGPVRALHNVDLRVDRGEVLALIGENGAGKSTLMKILSGAYTPGSGEIRFRDKAFKPGNPAAGRRAGIAMIYQELTLAPHLSVAENITLGIESASMGFVRKDRARLRECLASLGHGDLDFNQPVGHLSIGMQQVVEIARAIYSNAEVIIMDEPTSSLSQADTAALFKIVKILKEKNLAVIYISHFLEEVKEIADNYTVLRDGESVESGSLRDTSIDGLIEAMVGRKLTEMFPRIPHGIGVPALEVKDLYLDKDLEPVSFTLHRGEILGIGGLVGSGRTEVLRRLFGLDKAEFGQVAIANGRNLKISGFSPAKSLRHGLDFLSENRKEEGLAVKMSIAANVTLSGMKRYRRFGFLIPSRETAGAGKWCEKLNVKRRNELQPVSGLSGGNQQKVALARLLHHDSDIFFLDEPTRGIDVGSKAEIYRLIMELASAGKSIVVVSSYLPELFGVCDSLAVMHRFRMSPAKRISEWNDASVMKFATSGA